MNIGLVKVCFSPVMAWQDWRHKKLSHMSSYPIQALSTLSQSTHGVIQALDGFMKHYLQLLWITEPCQAMVQKNHHAPNYDHMNVMNQSDSWCMLPCQPLLAQNLLAIVLVTWCHVTSMLLAHNLSACKLPQCCLLGYLKVCPSTLMTCTPLIISPMLWLYNPLFLNCCAIAWSSSWLVSVSHQSDNGYHSAPFFMVTWCRSSTC